MKTDLVNNLKYELLMPGFPIGNVSLYDRAFALWSKTWQEVFSASHSMESYNVDDFWRQQMMSVIYNNDQIVALHFYNFFDLRTAAAIQHSYLSPMPYNCLQSFQGRHISHVMNMEFLTIAANWKRSVTGLSMGAVMTSLGLNLMRELGVEVAIGFPRKDAKVNRMTYDLGFQTLVETVEKCNYPCELVACFLENIKLPADNAESSLVKELWTTGQIDPRISSLFSKSKQSVRQGSPELDAA